MLRAAGVQAYSIRAFPGERNPPCHIPDGRLLAYASDETGRYEVRWPISNTGGAEPGGVASMSRVMVRGFLPLGFSRTRNSGNRKVPEWPRPRRPQTKSIWKIQPAVGLSLFGQPGWMPASQLMSFPL